MYIFVTKTTLHCCLLHHLNCFLIMYCYARRKSYGPKHVAMLGIVEYSTLSPLTVNTNFYWFIYVQRDEIRRNIKKYRVIRTEVKVPKSRHFLKSRLAEIMKYLTVVVFSFIRGFFASWQQWTRMKIIWKISLVPRCHFLMTKRKTIIGGLEL